MNASIAIQVLPQVEREQVIGVVDQVIAHIKASGLSYEVSAFETTVEGEYNTLMELVRQCSLICVEAGAPSVMTYVKIHYNPQGVWSIEEKTGKHRQ